MAQVTRPALMLSRRCRCIGVAFFYEALYNQGFFVRARENCDKSQENTAAAIFRMENCRSFFIYKK